MTAPDRPAGSVTISPRALTRIVERAAASVPGVTEHGGGLDRVTGRRFPRFDVRVNDASTRADVEAHIAIVWPAPAVAIARAVQETVAEWLDAMAGIEARAVDVEVGHAERAPRRLTEKEVAAARCRPQVAPAHARALQVWRPRYVVRHPHAATWAPLRPVTFREPPARSPKVVARAGTRPRRVTAPAPAPARSVTTPRSAPVARVNTPTPGRVRATKAPRPAPVARIAAPVTSRVRPVRAPRPAPVLRVTAPAGSPSARPVRVAPPPAPPVVHVPVPPAPTTRGGATR